MTISKTILYHVDWFFSYILTAGNVAFEQHKCHMINHHINLRAVLSKQTWAEAELKRNFASLASLSVILLHFNLTKLKLEVFNSDFSSKKKDMHTI